MRGDAIYEKILDEISRMKTNNNVKSIREHLKLVEMLLELYRAEVSQPQTDSLLGLFKEVAGNSEPVPVEAADVPW